VMTVTPDGSIPRVKRNAISNELVNVSTSTPGPAAMNPFGTDLTSVVHVVYEMDTLWAVVLAYQEVIIKRDDIINFRSGVSIRYPQIIR
jgi:hypothetical protein